MRIIIGDGWSININSMKINLSDKIIAWLALFSGLTVSAVAIYYSVAGLVAIFSAAVIPIIVMGVALEISKLSATVWLKQNWTRAPNFIRGYLLAAIAILMLITSMGIFGFLSKAHSDQSLVSGDVQSKIAVYDEKIKTEKENIEANRKALKQMDEGVDQVLGRSTDEKGADKAVALRRSQQKERARLQNEISQSQKLIAELNDARAPIAAEVRKVEAEVGPIKYIANFIYGDNPDANILEKAVTWVIIIIVIVFDPLAVILLLASQYSFAWFRQQEEETPQEQKQIEEEPEPAEEMASDIYEIETAHLSQGPVVTNGLWPFPSHIGQKPEEVKDKDFKFLAEDKDLYPEGKTWEENSSDEMRDEYDFSQGKVGAVIQKTTEDSDLDKWNKMIEEAEKAAAEEKEENEIFETAHQKEKEAMAKWKAENPDSSLKMQRKLLDRGVIDKLPWEEYLEPKPDFVNEEDEAAVEAAKWAQEQLEKTNSKKKDSDLDGETGRSTDQEIQGNLSGYKQNAEQNEKTLWNRIQESKK